VLGFLDFFILDSSSDNLTGLNLERSNWKLAVFWN